MKTFCDSVNRRDDIFEKALLLLILISYIQPFNDGNKRTARIVSNAELMAHDYCPISFRTVDSIDYKKAMLVFYEQNNLSAFKKNIYRAVRICREHLFLSCPEERVRTHRSASAEVIACPDAVHWTQAAEEARGPRNRHKRLAPVAPRPKAAKSIRNHKGCALYTGGGLSENSDSPLPSLKSRVTSPDG